MLSNDPPVRADFSDFKLVKSRSAAQVILEVPIEAGNAVLQALGGLPIPGESRWVEIRLVRASTVEKKKTPARERYDALPAEQQAVARCAMACAEADFEEWLKRTNRLKQLDGSVEQCVRRLCGVTSRADIATNQRAYDKWIKIETAYRDWQDGLEEVAE